MRCAGELRICASAMPWPFSRSKAEPANREAGEGSGRRAEARDPAAELRARTRRRLIGAAALLLAAVILLPMLLDTTPRPLRDDVSISVVGAPQPITQPAGSAPLIDEKIAEPVPAPSEPPPAVEPPEKAGKTSPAQAVRPAPPAAAPAAEKFAVQVAALSTAAAAKDLVARLKKGGFAAYIEAVSTASGTLHRVRVGPFASRDEAQRAAEKVKAAGHRATVVSG